MASIFNVFNKDWTIRELMNVDQTRAAKASSCHVMVNEVYHELQQESILEKFKKFFIRRKDLMNVYYIIFKFIVISDTGNSYNVFIRTMSDPYGTEYMNNKIQVYCGCSDFMYRSAWALNNHNALFKTSKTLAKLGAAIKDAPKGKTKTSVLCKHVAAAVTYFIQNYNYLMKSA